MARVRDARGRFTKQGSGLVVYQDTLTPGLESFGPKLGLGIRAVMRYHEPQVERYMKANAPWRDQTANARNGLAAKAVSSQDVHAIVVYHQVPYGPWLEVRHNGRYRIIIPTIISQGREVMKTVQGLLGRMKAGL